MRKEFMSEYVARSQEGGGGGERKGETWVALTKIEGDFVEEKQPNTMFESL